MNKSTTMLLLISLLSLGGCLSIITSGYIAEGDTNKDGSLSFEEFLVLQKNNENQVKDAKELGLTDEEHAKQKFKKFDTNKNGLITKEEILTYFENGGE